MYILWSSGEVRCLETDIDFCRTLVAPSRPAAAAGGAAHARIALSSQTPAPIPSPCRRLPCLDARLQGTPRALLHGFLGMSGTVGKTMKRKRKMSGICVCVVFGLLVLFCVCLFVFVLPSFRACPNIRGDGECREISEKRSNKNVCECPGITWDAPQHARETMNTTSGTCPGMSGNVRGVVWNVSSNVSKNIQERVWKLPFRQPCKRCIKHPYEGPGGGNNRSSRCGCGQWQPVRHGWGGERIAGRANNQPCNCGCTQTMNKL